MQWYVCALVSTVRCIDQNAGSACCLYLVCCLLSTPILYGPTVEVFPTFYFFSFRIPCIALWFWLWICVLLVAHAYAAIFSFWREKMWSVNVIGWCEAWFIASLVLTVLALLLLLSLLHLPLHFQFQLIVKSLACPIINSTSIFP